MDLFGRWFAISDCELIFVGFLSGAGGLRRSGYKDILQSISCFCGSSGSSVGLKRERGSRSHLCFAPGLLATRGPGGTTSLLPSGGSVACPVVADGSSSSKSRL